MKQKAFAFLFYTLFFFLSIGPIGAPLDGKTRSIAPLTTATPVAPKVLPDIALPANTTQVTVLAPLNVRSGLGLQYGVISQLAVGATIQVQGRSTNSAWWLLQEPVAGQAGWISADPNLTHGQAAEAEPQILAFTLTPTTTQAIGAPFTITWQARAEHAELCQLTATTLGNCEAVPVSGQQTVTTNQAMLGVSAFVLRVTSGQKQITRAVAVRLQCHGLREWFFANPPSVCPATAPVTTHAAIQHFEQGLMIWTEQPAMFYVFFNEKGSVDGEQQYIMVSAPYTAQSSRGVNATPPINRQAPSSRFGQLWRGEIANPHQLNLRTLLGWATEPESSFAAISQCELITVPHYWHCYLQGPSREIFSLHPDSTAQARLLWTLYRH